MKGKKVNIILASMLLTLVLTGNVGLHLFHHHEITKAGVVQHSGSAKGDFSIQEQEADCLLCHLDAFQDQTCVSYSVSSLSITLLKPDFCFFVPASASVSISKKGRGPPVSVV